MSRSQTEVFESLGMKAGPPWCVWDPAVQDEEPHVDDPLLPGKSLSIMRIYDKHQGLRVVYSICATAIMHQPSYACW